VIASGLLAGALTLAAYALARLLHGRVRSILVLPIVVAATVLGAGILLLGVDPATYEDAARPISFWLGPATVALAVPLHRERARLRAHFAPIVVGVTVGACVSIGCVLLLGVAMHLSPTLVRSLAPKSVTTPIAMPIATRLGGIPQVTAAVVVVTGIVGMVIGPRLLDLAGVRDPVARGVALGTSAHGIGTARAIEEGPTQGAIAGVAIVISGLVTALVAPWIVG
jgi:predicted murein hydrolase (TIGR00659 family)